MRGFDEAAQAMLARAVRADGEADRPLAGVVAMLADRERTLYAGAAGVRRLGDEARMTTDTVLAIFSATKAITATACLSLMEEGRLDLDAPARRYAPRIGELCVIEGFDAAGEPRLRAPRTEITTRMLLLHTAGFGYDFFNATYDRLARERGQPGIVTCRLASLETPLLFDPGEGWEYGSGVDWAGQVVEAIEGRRLGAVLARRVLEPCAMTATAFRITPSMRERLATIHQRGEDGALAPLDGYELPQEPEFEMGGGGLYGTAEDYMRFIGMWLRDGMGERGRVLAPKTVAMAERGGLGGLAIHALPGVRPRVSRDAEFFPGLPKSWAIAGMVVEAEAPTGRSAGSVGWAGLANLYYWIDRRRGIGGLWATQLFPFADPAALAGFTAFETAAYDALGRAAAR